MVRCVQYLTFDSIREGVGSSQVVNYLKRLSRDWDIELVNFEKRIDVQDVKRMHSLGINWNPINFGRFGFLGGLWRVFALRRRVKSESIVHARSDFSALAAILAGSSRVIWDCRAITPDQRIAQKKKRKFSIEYMVLRVIEYICAIKSQRIIVITKGACEFLMNRYNLPREKFLHVSTCVELDSFRPSLKYAFKDKDSLNIAFIGTLGRHYDIDLMNRIVSQFRSKINTKFTIALSEGSTTLYSEMNYDELVHLGHDEMPEFINSQDIGISIWRKDMGVSLISVAATKNAEFLACGKPIIVNIGQGDIGRLVLDYKVGVATSDDSNLSISRYVEDCLYLLRNDSSLAKRCVDLAYGQYSLEKGTNSISQLYSELDRDGI